TGGGADAAAGWPSGRIIDGRFVDDTFRMSIAVPSGWVVELGSAEDALRIRLIDEVTGAVIELWEFSAVLTEPVPRPGCAWAFQDRGPYRGVPTNSLIMVATCTPDDPGAPRVFAWLVGSDQVTWQVELHTPAERLSEARQAGEAILQTLRF
ncbi:MAG: hypothetical protein ACI8S6_004984, partial [Myxococcota bacterium]